MTTEETAFNDWFDAVMADSSLEEIREKRAIYENLTGSRFTGELCGDYVPEPVKSTFERNRAEEELEESPTPREALPGGRNDTLLALLLLRGQWKPKERTPERIVTGSRVREARKQAGHESARLCAEATGLPFGTLNSIEGGYLRLTNKSAQRIAIALGCSLTWLLTGQGEPFPTTQPDTATTP